MPDLSHTSLTASTFLPQKQQSGAISHKAAAVNKGYSKTKESYPSKADGMRKKKKEEGGK